MAFSPLSLWERARVRVSALKLDHLQTGTLAMPTALYRLILALLLWLPLAAHADDASDFAAANLPQQVKLLESWAAQPDPARTELIMALQQGQITVDGQPTQDGVRAVSPGDGRGARYVKDVVSVEIR